VRINDLRNGKFTIFIVELLKGPVYFNVLKIKLDFIFNIKANRWLAVLIREFLLLLLYRDYRNLYLIPCLA
jgi:hypothetical protein